MSELPFRSRYGFLPRRNPVDLVHAGMARDGRLVNLAALLPADNRRIMKAAPARIRVPTRIETP
jgi:hypothetical protein